MLRRWSTLPFLLLLLPTAAQAQSVLLLTDGDEPTALAIASTLEAEPPLAAGAVHVRAVPTTPEESDLAPYDVVAVWTQGAWNDAASLGDRLAAFVDGGGAVVVLAPAWTVGTEIGGAFQPIAPAAPAAAGPLTLPLDPGSFDLSLPLWDGVVPDALLFVDHDQGALSPAPTTAPPWSFGADGAGGIFGLSRCDRAVTLLQVAASDLLEGPPLVSDDLGRFVANTLVFGSTDTLPTLEAGGPYTAIEGGAVSLDGLVVVAGSAGPPTIAWDLDDDGVFDDSTDLSPTFDAAGTDGPSTHTVRVRIEDPCGRVLTDEALVEIANAAPTLGVVPDQVIEEATSTTIDAIATDLGPDTLNYTWTWDDGAPPQDGPSISRSFADDGVVVGTVTAEDDDGATDTVTVVIDVINVAPTFDALVGPPSVFIGSAGLFSGVAVDAAGGSDPLTYQWSASDGAPGASGPAYSWSPMSADPVQITVVADDGDGGTVTGSFSVVASSQGPTLSWVTRPTIVDEGQAATFTLAAVTPLDTTATVAWGSSAGPGAPAVEGQWSWTFTPADDGPQEVSATVVDAFGGMATLSTTLVVRNVAPTFTGVPPVGGTEGVTMFGSFTATDPGADTLSFVPVTLPSGATLGGDGSFTFTPSFEQCSPALVQVAVRVEDGDGGATTTVHTITLSVADADGDSLPDTWEAANGLPSTEDNSATDSDGDGLSDVDEYQMGRDPSQSGAPGVPLPVAPAGQDVATPTPTLEAAPTADPEGDALVVRFQIASDSSFSTILDEGAVPSTSPTTEYTTPQNLTENTTHHWRVRAEDPWGESAWSSAVPFFVDALPEPPGAPSPWSPLGGTVDSPWPDLLLGPATDPEGRPLTILGWLQEGEQAPVAFPTHDLGDGTHRIVLEMALSEDTTYRFAGEALDASGLSSGLGPWAEFTMDLVNQSPAPPSWLSPDDGARIDDLPAAASLESAADPDGDPVIVRLQGSADPAFPPGGRTETLAEPTGGGTVDLEWSPSIEDAPWYLRARAEDPRGGQSPWVVRAVHIDATESAPSAPRVLAPLPGESQDTAGWAVRLQAGIDADGDALQHMVRLVDAAGAERWAWTFEADAVLETTVDVGLEVGNYTLTAVALDSTGLGSVPSTPVRVVVPGLGAGLIDLGEQDSGCDGAPDAATWIPLLVLLLRRRPRA